MSANPNNGLSQVPLPIAEKLRRLIRRSRVVITVRGGAAVTAVAVASLLGIMAIDAGVTIFSAWPRWALTLSALAVTLLSALWFLFRPLAHSFTLRGMAQIIERGHPEFQERLSSVVELLSSHDAPELRGSEQLIGALTQEATEAAVSVQPKREIRLRPALPYVVAAGMMMLILSALLILVPGRAAQLLARAVAPYLDLPNVRGLDLTVEPGDATVVEGQSLNIEVRVANRAVTAAQVRTIARDQTQDTVTAMLPASPPGAEQPKFTLTLPPAVESFRYRILAGDALSRYYKVNVQRRPAVTRLEIEYEYPPYTFLKPLRETMAEGRIRALVDTKVTLTVFANKPLSAARFYLNDRVQERIEPELSALPDGTSVCKFRLRMDPKLKGTYGVTLVDRFGFESLPARHPLEPTTDMPPVLRIAQPLTTQLRLKPGDKLPVVYLAKDDYGLSELQMLITADGAKQPPVALPLGDSPRPLQAGGRTYLDLGQAQLKDAKRVTFQLRAADILPASLQGPQQQLSPVYTIDLDQSASPYSRQIQMAEELQIRAKLEKALAQLRQAKDLTVPMTKSWRKTTVVWPAMEKKVETVRERLGGAETDVREAANIALGGEFEAMYETLNDVAEQNISKAHNLSGQIKMADSVKQRADLVDETDLNIGTAIRILSDILKNLGSMSELARHAKELQALADKEARLAHEAAQTPQPSQQQKDELNREQKDIAKQLGQKLAANPAAMKAEKQQSAQEAKNLIAEARKLAEQQEQIAQQTQKVAQGQQAKATLQELAQRQKQLAAQAAQDPATAPPAAPMQEAARQLAAAKPADALPQQASAEEALKKAAEDLQRQHGESAPLAEQARQLAEKQHELAKQAAKAALARDTAQHAADADKALLEKAQKKEQQAQDSLTQQMAALQKRQNQLAAEAAGVQQQVAKDPNASPEAKAAKPFEAMDKAAKDMTPQTAAQAKQSSQKAADEAAQLSQKLKGNKDVSGLHAQARKLATEQAALAQKVAKLAEPSPHQAKNQTKSNAAEEAAKQDLARHEQAVAQADKALKDLAEKQEQLAHQAGELAKKAEQSGGKAKEAAAAHDPTDLMKEAAQAMKGEQAKGGEKNQPGGEKPSGEGQGQDKKPQSGDQQAKGGEKNQPGGEKPSGEGQGQDKKPQSGDQQAKGGEKNQPGGEKPSGEGQGQDKKPQSGDQQAKGGEKNQPGGEKPSGEGQGQDKKPQSGDQQAKGGEKNQPGGEKPSGEGQGQDKKPQSGDQQAKGGKKSSGQPSSAGAEEAKAAALKADQLAKALAGEAGLAGKTAAQKAAKLAEAQKLLREETAKALGQQDPALAPTELERIKHEQAELDAKAAKLSNDVKATAPMDDRLDSETLRAIRNTSESLQANNLPQAAGQAAEAAAKAKQLGERLQNAAAAARQELPPSQDQGVKSPQEQAAEKKEKLAQQAGEIADKQQYLAKQMQALAENRPADLLASRQEEAQQATAELKKDVDLLRDNIQDLSPEPGVAEAAASASRQMEKASQSQQQASGQMSRGQMGAAQASQQSAAGAERQAAADLERLAQKMQESANRMAGPPGDAEAQQLAQSYDAAQKAAASGQPTDLEKAAKLMAQLAKSAGDNAMAMGAMMDGPPGSKAMAGQKSAKKPSRAMESKMGAGAMGLQGISEAKLKALGLTPADWARLPGELRSEVLQSAEETGPREYRDLIKRYFEEVSSRGGASPTTGGGK